ncbi:MAG: cupin domain-containing protein [Syntrophaceae bacterium]|nr:cupin domain-containing protein [Syntrophaceae bacterium]
MELKSWKNIEPEQLNENTSRKMVWGENVMAVLIELAPNSKVPLHDHVSEQMTMVQKGKLYLCFPGQDDVELNHGDVLIIPPSQPHSAKSGPEGCVVMDVFSPIRQDFIEGSASYFSDDHPDKPKVSLDPYRALRGYLAGVGIDVPIDTLRQTPLDILARYVYEKECITMGQLREVLGIDKKQAKDLLRKWKHGDDHSESSYRRKLERLIVLPNEIARYTVD